MTGRSGHGPRPWVYRSWDDPFPDADTAWMESTDRSLFLSITSRLENGTNLSWQQIATARPGSPLDATLVGWATAIEGYDHPLDVSFNPSRTPPTRRPRGHRRAVRRHDGGAQLPGGRAAQGRWIAEAQELFTEPGDEGSVGVAYWNQVSHDHTGCDVRVTSSAASPAAFRTMAHDPFYAGTT